MSFKELAERLEPSGCWIMITGIFMLGVIVGGALVDIFKYKKW